MSDARSEYEEKVNSSYHNFMATIAGAYQQWADDCDRAWYNYQVRTGMVTIERTSSAQDRDDDNPDPSGGSGRDPGTRPEQPPAGEVGNTVVSSSAEVSEAAGTAVPGDVQNP